MRSDVSGVRSSWPASATSWRCRSRDGRQRGEHRVEGRRPAGRSRRCPRPVIGVELLGAGDLLDGVAEPPHRAQPVARHGPAGEAGADHAEESEQGEHDAELAERVLGRLQRLGEDQRGALLVCRARRPPGRPVRRSRRCGRTASALPCATASSGVGQLDRPLVGHGRRLEDGLRPREDRDLHVGRAEHPATAPAGSAASSVGRLRGSRRRGRAASRRARRSAGAAR